LRAIIDKSIAGKPAPTDPSGYVSVSAAAFCREWGGSKIDRGQ